MFLSCKDIVFLVNWKSEHALRLSLQAKLARLQFLLMQHAHLRSTYSCIHMLRLKLLAYIKYYNLKGSLIAFNCLCMQHAQPRSTNNCIQKL